MQDLFCAYTAPTILYSASRLDPTSLSGREVAGVQALGSLSKIQLS